MVPPSKKERILNIIKFVLLIVSSIGAIYLNVFIAIENYRLYNDKMLILNCFFIVLLSYQLVRLIISLLNIWELERDLEKLKIKIEKRLQELGYSIKVKKN